MELIEEYRIFDPNMRDYTFFSMGHGMLSKTNHILKHREP